MAIIHKATLSPSKLELLAAFLEERPDLFGKVGDGLSQVGAYRFDDPAGNVGIETHILTDANGALFQMPLVYRNDELPEAADRFLGTMEHSVLGTRWVYDACSDPIYIGELVRTILTGGTEVAEMVETEDGPVQRPSTVQVNGSGDSEVSVEIPGVIEASRSGDQTIVDIGDYVVMISHVLDVEDSATDLHLAGVWTGQDTPVNLVRMVCSGAHD